MRERQRERDRERGGCRERVWGVHSVWHAQYRVTQYYMVSHNSWCTLYTQSMVREQCIVKVFLHANRYTISQQTLEWFGQLPVNLTSSPNAYCRGHTCKNPSNDCNPLSHFFLKHRQVLMLQMDLDIHTGVCLWTAECKFTSVHHFNFLVKMLNAFTIELYGVCHGIWKICGQ